MVLSIGVDNNNQPFVLKQIRITYYAPQIASGLSINGYIDLGIVGQTGWGLTFGAPNWLSNAHDTYGVIEILPPTSLPAMARISFPEIFNPLASGSVSSYMEKDKKVGANYTAIRMRTNAMNGWLVGTHIVVEGVDA